MKKILQLDSEHKFDILIHLTHHGHADIWHWATLSVHTTWAHHFIGSTFHGGHFWASRSGSGQEGQSDESVHGEGLDATKMLLHFPRELLYLKSPGVGHLFLNSFSFVIFLLCCMIIAVANVLLLKT